MDQLTSILVGVHVHVHVGSVVRVTPLKITAWCVVYEVTLCKLFVVAVQATGMLVRVSPLRV